MPADLVEGVNKTEFNFIGFTPLIDLLTNFNNEVSSLSNLSNNF